MQSIGGSFGVAKLCRSLSNCMAALYLSADMGAKQI